ncbi:hypothetical protein J6590_038878 [Homalodisca vitripennis]|nr:hypothetical protein J6590_038878 [Homalodisca vitripennis]
MTERPRWAGRSGSSSLAIARLSHRVIRSSATRKKSDIPSQAWTAASVVTPVLTWTPANRRRDAEHAPLPPTSLPWLPSSPTPLSRPIGCHHRRLLLTLFDIAYDYDVNIICDQLSST